MLRSELFYWIWIGLFVSLVLLNAVSEHILSEFKRLNLKERWDKDTSTSTFANLVGNHVHFELMGREPVWVKLNTYTQRLYMVYTWSGRFAAGVFVLPILSILALYFLELV
jgi:hypothetical protein